MANEAEHDAPDELSERVDSALEAFWRGDSAALEDLLRADGSDDEEMPLGSLLGGVVQEQTAPVVGLPGASDVGGYKIIREIGHGGMGVVYEAEQQNPRRRVALKVLRGLVADEHQVKLFRREIQVLARLRHPGIATIYEAGCTTDGQHFFTMELVSGVPLTEYIRGPRRSAAEQLQLFLALCDAVAYAHQQGVIHRDLKPSNIMVDADGRVRVLDFGLARITGADVSLTQTAAPPGQIVGTLRYMSPGQARGDPAEIDERSDVYALGVILYELLTGQPPYDLDRVPAHEAVRIICEQPPRRPSTANPKLRGDLDTILFAALAKESGRRYPSVAAFAADIQRYLRAEPVLAHPPSGLYVLRRKLAKHRAAVVAVGALAALGLLGLGGALWQHARALADARAAAVELEFHAEDGRANIALPAAVALVGRYPSLPEAHLVLAQAQFRMYRETGDPILRQLAIHDLSPLVGNKPSHWACRALLAVLLGDDEARERANREAPDTADAWYLRTYTTLSAEDAWSNAKTALQRQPDRDLAPLVWRRFAYLALVTKRFEDAVSAARRPAAVDRDPAWWTLFEGHVLTRQGRYADAIERYTRAATLAPNPAMACRYRGVCCLCRKDYARAADEYSQAAIADVRQPYTFYMRATPLWILGRTAEAAADFRASQRFGAFAEYASLRLFLVLHDRAVQLDREGRPDAARECRQEAERRLANAATQGWAGKIYECLAGRLSPEELVREAGHSVKLRCEACYYAGERCRLNQDIDQARTWFEQCRDTGLALDPATFPPDPMNEYHLAVWRLDELAAVAGRPSQPAE
jgi:tetratricopeptide (TPR) repeat protein/predicted Ser/Thr protein kinase